MLSEGNRYRLRPIGKPPGDGSGRGAEREAGEREAGGRRAGTEDGRSGIGRSASKNGRTELRNRAIDEQEAVGRRLRNRRSASRKRKDGASESGDRRTDSGRSALAKRLIGAPQEEDPCAEKGVLCTEAEKAAAELGPLSWDVRTNLLNRVLFGTKREGFGEKKNCKGFNR